MTNKNIQYDLLKNKDWMYKKYQKEMLSIYKIAKRCQCNPTTVLKYLKQHGIKRREKSEAGIIFFSNTNIQYNFLNDKEWLYKKYWGENKSASQIAKICNCGKKTVLRYLEKHGIKRRTNSESQKLKIVSEETKQKISKAIGGINHPLYGKSCSKETKRKISEGNKGKIHTEETKQKMSKSHKGKVLTKKAKQKLAKYWTDERRKERSKKYSGENNPSWKP